MADETKTFPCDHCNRVFNSQRQVNRHMNYINAYRQCDCPVPGCGRSFTSNSQLQAHKKVHNDTRPFVCESPGCTYRGRTSSQLIQHRVTHGLGYVYTCDLCGYQATTSSNLRRHARLHLNTRPYVCPHCSRTFVELSALRRHVLDSAHHPGLPLYVCPWCSSGSAFTSLPSSGDVESPLPLVITSPVEVIGFNSSSLAWRHVQKVHSQELSRPETLKRLGKKPKEVLIEHDVSLIFGLYHPNQDAKFRPSGAVRSSVRSVGKSHRPKGRMQDISLSKSSAARQIYVIEKGSANICNNKNDLSVHLRTPETLSLPDSLPYPHSRTRVQIQVLKESPSSDGGYVNGDGFYSNEPPFDQIQGLICLPAGVIWSSAAFNAALGSSSSTSATTL